MNSKYYKRIDRVLGTVKVLLAVFMMVVGIFTMFIPLEPMGGALGIIYGTRISLVSFGLIFFSSGLTLFLGKILRKRKWVGRGLMAIYLCFMFAAILNGVALDWAVESWSPNALAALITAGLWLWWRVKTEYVRTDEFHAEILQMKKKHHKI